MCLNSKKGGSDMSRLRTEATANPRAMLNTTIKTETLNSFKAYCREIGMPMNMILEVFMEQFVAGEFVLKIGRANKMNVDLVEISEENNQ